MVSVTRNYYRLTPLTNDMSDHAITLYRLQACPFCERVVRRLGEYGLDYDSRFVEPLHSRRNVVKRESGVRTVPVIVDERTGITIAESANIVEYLDGTYGPGGEYEQEARGTPADLTAGGGA